MPIATWSNQVEGGKRARMDASESLDEPFVKHKRPAESHTAGILTQKLVRTKHSQQQSANTVSSDCRKTKYSCIEQALVEKLTNWL